MKNYHIVLGPDEETADVYRILKKSGCTWEPSGYGSGVYISITATPSQADYIGAELEKIA